MLKEILTKMQTKNENDSAFYRISFEIKDISTNDVAAMRHDTFWKAPCKGFVKNGICQNCYENIEGIAAYSFKAIINDVENDKITTIVSVADRASELLFGLSAQAFLNADDNTRKLAIENIMFVPFKADVSVKYKKDSNDDALVSIFDPVHDNGDGSV